MSSKTDNPDHNESDALRGVQALSMRRLRATEEFWTSPRSYEAQIAGRPVLFWVMEQAAKARVDRDSVKRLSALNIISWLLDRKHGQSGVHGGNTLLMEAAILGDVAIARRLLRAGAPIDQRSAMGQTALHWAARAGRPAMCKFLLAEGAALDPLNHNRETPLHCAADHLRMNTITVLHEAAAAWDVKDVHDRTPLDVIQYRDPSLVRVWANKPERDRLATAVAKDMSSLPSPSTGRGRRL